VRSDGKDAVAQNADTPLAVGSAAKLAILKALKDAVADGRLRWDQTVPLKSEWRSLPTGILQDWPPGTSVTIATLGTLMMSLSDNTATDALIDLVGRANVEAITPRNTPFPTTAELFKLKTKGRGDLRAKWRSADAAGRRSLLDTIAALPLPKVADLEPAATAEIEWFFSAHELCGLLEATAGMPMFINPGLADAAAWRSVAFKGGSETGVLNLSTRLAGDDGAVHCVVATWNTAETLDQRRLYEPFRGLLRVLRAPAAAK
jgi:beta-lactamase class A